MIPAGGALLRCTAGKSVSRGVILRLLHSSSARFGSVERAYQQLLVDKEDMRLDSEQLGVISRLDVLHSQLSAYGNARRQYELDLQAWDSHRKQGGHTRVEDSGIEKPSSPRVPRGLYIFGEVGTGKSLCMDLFYGACDNVIEEGRKRRVHFHDFMSEVHERVHAWKHEEIDYQTNQQGRKYRRGAREGDGKLDLRPEADALLHVSKAIAAEAWLLCFDEFQVTDVADALIMSKLFGTMWGCGTVVVATSNRGPEELYSGGLNRRDFLPFIDTLKRRCASYSLMSSEDYRMAAGEPNKSSALYRVETLPMKLAQAEDELFQKFCLGEDAGENNTADVKVPTAFGRSISISSKNIQGRAVKLRFTDLCDSDLGAADYRSLATTFDSIVVTGIPILTKEGHNRARRFITLVDQFYESKVRLGCTAAAPPTDIFHNLDDSNIKTRDGELAAVKELDFAFRRAASRLVEMGSRSYQKEWEKKFRS